MMNPRGEVSVTVAGKNYVLRYTMRAMNQMEKELDGRGLAGFRGTIVLLWALLLHDNPRMSLDQAADIVDKAIQNKTEWDNLQAAMAEAQDAWKPEWLKETEQPTNGVEKNVPRATTGADSSAVPPKLV